MSDETRSRTIFNQLGGERFRVMTGAKNFGYDNTSLDFALPTGTAKEGINRVQITLTPDDLYTMSFYSIRGTKVREVEIVEGVYWDSLQDVFTRVTGLSTKL